VPKTANEIRRRVGISAISVLLLAVSATLGFLSHSEGCYDLPLTLGLAYVSALVSSLPSFVRLFSIPRAPLSPALLPEERRSVVQRAIRCSSTSIPFGCGSTVSFGVDATFARAVAYRKREDCFSTFIVEYCCNV
jgi:hypothetical protein